MALSYSGRAVAIGPMPTVIGHITRSSGDRGAFLVSSLSFCVSSGATVGDGAVASVVGGSLLPGALRARPPPAQALARHFVCLCIFDVVRGGVTGACASLACGGRR